jgi:hypothetical protein
VVGTSGKGRVNGEGGCGGYIYVYENRTMEPVEIFLGSGRRGMRENDEGVNLIKKHCKHACKCCNDPHTTNTC